MIKHEQVFRLLQDTISYAKEKDARSTLFEPCLSMVWVMGGISLPPGLAHYISDEAPSKVTIADRMLGAAILESIDGVPSHRIADMCAELSKHEITIPSDIAIEAAILGYWAMFDEDRCPGTVLCIDFLSWFLERTESPLALLFYIDKEDCNATVEKHAEWLAGDCRILEAKMKGLTDEIRGS